MRAHLFDVTTGVAYPGDNKGRPRQANEAEAKAYADFLRRRQNLPDLGHLRLSTLLPPSWSRGDFIYCGATFGKRTAEETSYKPDNAKNEWDRVRVPAQYEDGAFSVIFPGYHLHRARVTMDELDGEGAVVRSSTLPADPRKGGVAWSRDDVRRVAGPIAKPAKAKRGKVAPAPIVETAPAEPVEAIQAVAGTPEGSEPVEALTGPDFAPVAVIVADPDPLEALAARLAALEARVAALPVETVEAPTAVADRPRRTPAHERAIRWAWAQRRAARLQRSIAEDHLRMREQVQEAYNRSGEERREMRKRIDDLEGQLQRETAEWEALQHRTWEQAMGFKMKRRRAVILARERGKRLEAEHRLVDRYQEKRREAEESAREWSRKEESQRRRADVAEAALAKLRADLADPNQPERASDIARLVRERDEARTALAAVDARNRALQSTVNDLADRFEAMVSRVTRAEAALRAAGVPLTLSLPAPAAVVA